MTGRSVLLVEDNAITRKMVRFALESRGYAVLVAGSGEEALERIRQRPDLVLLDLVLPDGSGFDLLTRLRQLPEGRDVPILACSGFVSKLEEARIGATGFSDVITKPVEPSRLIQIVRAHLPSDEPAEPFGAGRRALLVDDDALQLKLVAHRLARYGFAIVTACDGQDGLEQARERKPDIVISDVMMPRLDGFGLCQHFRNDPALEAVPLVLLTNSYVEADDRELARRVGADDLVVRTPELRELVDAARRVLHVERAPSTVPPVSSTPEIEQERARRVIRQLEKQVALNAGLVQRCASLSAELSVLSGISAALAQGRDAGAALDAALAACMDAGGVSRGVLYVFGAGQGRTRVFGDRSTQQLASAFHDDELRALLAGGKTRLLTPSEGAARGLATGAMLVPLAVAGELVGALLLEITTERPHEPDRIAFAEGVGNQIALALALARSFAGHAEAERAAKQNAALLESILDGITDGVVAVDPEGRFTHWNTAAEAIVEEGPVSGQAAERPARFELFDADGSRPVAAAERPLAQALRGERVERRELFMRKQGATQGAWLSVNALPLWTPQRAIGGAVAVFRDVSAEKQAQTQLMISDRMASVGMLAAGVAHEINNPLAVVLANLGCAAQDVAGWEVDQPRPADLGPAIADAQEAAERVRHIVKDLKLFSRGEDDARGEVDVEQVLESSLRMAWNEIRHRAQLVRRYGRVRAVMGNESRLGQVFLNLIVNAAQAMPQGAANCNTLTVTTGFDAAEKRVWVEVADTGCGMPPDLLACLFTPFVTTKPRGVGTGLGLAICHRIVTSMGGLIHVTSAEGEGTTFRVALPAAQEAAMATLAEAPAAVERVRRGRVLAIDDEEMVLRALKRVLSAHEVTVTQSPVAAVQMATTSRFDVILCDLMMPVVSGMDFFAQLAAKAPEEASKVVFLTGGAFTAEARAFLDRVANRHLEKPVPPRELLDLIDERIGAAGARE